MSARSFVAWMAAGIALAVSAAAVPKPRETLPASARELLLPRMRGHRADLDRLLRAVVMLDRDQAARLADDIASADRLARPTGEAARELNALVPARFFALDEELAGHARDLAAAARRADDRAMAAAFGRVSATCVACHAAWMAEPAAR